MTEFHCHGLNCHRKVTHSCDSQVALETGNRHSCDLHFHSCCEPMEHPVEAEPAKTFWQWWASERYHRDNVGDGLHTPGEKLHDSCPPFRTRDRWGDPVASLNWTDGAKPMVLHCWDVFACHWPQIFVAAVFGRP